MGSSISRDQYGVVHGPTAGDRVRLGDTSLTLEIEHDHAVYGDELVVGWAKNYRNGMMIQGRQASVSELDTVIVGVIVVDPVLGIFKGSIGIKENRIVAIGNAGNPDIADDIDLVIGPGTVVIPGGRMIATPGGVDSHVHFVTPRLIPVALEGGVTTLIGGGLNHQPGVNLQIPLTAMETWPLNVGLQARASSHLTNAIDGYVATGACGFKVHEDMGSYGPIIDAALTVADDLDISVCLHTDGLNEALQFDETIAAIDGRTLHAYHVEGAGGGHTPDALMMATRDNIIPSSTTPTVPFGVGAVPEHIDMMSIMHGQNYRLDENIEAVRLRIRAESMAAEDILHDQGAISIINSDSQGMGRIQETIRRTWQLADANKLRGLADPMDSPDHDNARILRYLAKYTINPARTHGIAQHVGSLEPGRLADIVLWDPRFFGAKPEMVIKGGQVAWAPMGDGNASARLCEPTTYGPMWGGIGRASDRTSVHFMAQIAIDEGVPARIGTARQCIAVTGARHIGKGDLLYNDASPDLRIDPATGDVFDGDQRLTCDPIETYSLNRRYFLS